MLHDHRDERIFLNHTELLPFLSFPADLVCIHFYNLPFSVPQSCQLLTVFLSSRDMQNGDECQYLPCLKISQTGENVTRMPVMPIS